MKVTHNTENADIHLKNKHAWRPQGGDETILGGGGGLRVMGGCKCETLITWYPSRPLSASSGTSSVKRLFCGALAGAAGGETLGGAAVEGGKRTGGGSACTKDENNSNISVTDLHASTNEMSMPRVSEFIKVNNDFYTRSKDLILSKIFNHVRGLVFFLSVTLFHRGGGVASLKFILQNKQKKEPNLTETTRPHRHDMVWSPD